MRTLFVIVPPPSAQCCHQCSRVASYVVISVCWCRRHVGKDVFLPSCAHTFPSQAPTLSSVRLVPISPKAMVRGLLESQDHLSTSRGHVSETQIEPRACKVLRPLPAQYLGSPTLEAVIHQGQQVSLSAVFLTTHPWHLCFVSRGDGLGEERGKPTDEAKGLWLTDSQRTERPGPGNSGHGS